MSIWTYLILGTLLLTAELLYFGLANRLGIVDIPNDSSTHKEAAIRGGGIIFPLALLRWGILNSFAFPYLIAGFLLSAMVSFIDDFRGLFFYIRLPVHFLSATLLLMEVDYFNLSWYIWLPTIIILVGFINAFNFMDGINGITGLYSLLLTLFLFTTASLLFLHNWHTPLIILAISLLIFSFFNFRPHARCFAGDVGAISLGLWFGYYLSVLFKEHPSIIWLLPVAVYGVDSVMTILYRLLKGENIFHPHHHHLYQNLSGDWGWPHLQVASIYVFLQLIIDIIAIWLLITNRPSWPYVISAYLLLIGVYIAAKWQFIRKFPAKSY